VRSLYVFFPSPTSSCVSATDSTASSGENIREKSLISNRYAADQEGRADEAEHHKQEQLQKQKQGKGEWREELSSDSESIVSPSFQTSNSLHAPFPL